MARKLELFWRLSETDTSTAASEMAGYRYEDAYRRGNTYLDNGQFILARDAFRDAIQQLDEHHRSSFDDAAGTIWQHLVHEDFKPIAARIYNALGLALTWTYEFTEAEAALSTSLTLQPNFFPARHNLGLLWLMVGKSSEAITQFRQALDLESCANSYFLLGIAHRENVEFPEAITAFREVIRIDPKSADAYYNLSNVLNTIGEFSESLTALQEANRLEPRNVEYRSALKAAKKQLRSLKKELVSKTIRYTDPEKGGNTSLVEAHGLTAPGDLSGTTLSELLPKIRPKIQDIAAELPEAGREAFVRTVEVAATLAMGGKAPLVVTILKREHRYREIRAAYEKAPTAENAASLKAVLESLRAKQRELHLPPEPTDTLASHAYSQVRPSRAKGEPHSPAKPLRGRPKIAAAGLK